MIQVIICIIVGLVIMFVYSQHTKTKRDAINTIKKHPKLSDKKAKNITKMASDISITISCNITYNN